MESSVSGKTKGSRSVARSTPDLLGAPINPIYQPRDRESAGFITKIWPFLKIWFGIKTLNFPPVTSNHSQTRNSSIVRPPCFRSLPIILWKLTLVEKPRRSLPFRICVPQWSESQVQSLYDYSCITYCDTYLRKTIFSSIFADISLFLLSHSNKNHHLLLSHFLQNKPLNITELWSVFSDICWILIWYSIRDSRNIEIYSLFVNKNSISSSFLHVIIQLQDRRYFLGRDDRALT